jgi:hypothetical protein
MHHKKILLVLTLIFMLIFYKDRKYDTVAVLSIIAMYMFVEIYKYEFLTPDEAVQNIASMYNANQLIASKITSTGDVEIGGNLIVKGNIVSRGNIASNGNIGSSTIKTSSLTAGKGLFDGVELNKLKVNQNAKMFKASIGNFFINENILGKNDYFLASVKMSDNGIVDRNSFGNKFSVTNYAGINTRCDDQTDLKGDVTWNHGFCAVDKAKKTKALYDAAALEIGPIMSWDSVAKYDFVPNQ